MRPFPYPPPPTNLSKVTYEEGVKMESNHSQPHLERGEDAESQDKGCEYVGGDDATKGRSQEEHGNDSQH